MRVTSGSSAAVRIELGARVRPHFRIDVEPIRRDHIDGAVDLALLAAEHVVGHRREPDVGVEPDLVAGVTGDHGAAARLRHVADQ